MEYHKQVILVDFNPVNSSIRRNSLIGEFDLVTSHHSPITFSLRVVGFDATLDWLKANFPELSVH